MKLFCIVPVALLLVGCAPVRQPKSLPPLPSPIATPIPVATQAPKPKAKQPAIETRIDSAPRKRYYPEPKETPKATPSPEPADEVIDLDKQPEVPVRRSPLRLSPRPMLANETLLYSGVVFFTNSS